ncbi:hypothetical protein [Ferdinandcohnia sp. Marseille-Q9671]
MKESYLSKESKFPKHKLNQEQRSRIISTISLAGLRKNHYKNLIPLFTGVVILFLAIVIGSYSYHSIFIKENRIASNPSSFTIKLPCEILIEEQEGNHIFLKEGTVVGGVTKIDETEKQLLLSQPGIYEKNAIEDFKEPTQRVLIHVKQMHAIQTIHYLIEPSGKNIIYDLYFHANTPGYFGTIDYNTDIEMIHEIAKTFQIK